MHHAVADQHDVGDGVRCRAGISGGLNGELVQRVDDRAVQRRQTVIAIVGVADAAHQILAVGHLRIHAAGGGQHCARAQIAEVHGNRRRADIDRQAVDLLLVAGLHPDDLPILPDGERDLPVIGPHGVLEGAEQDRIDAQPREIEPRFQLCGQAIPIAELVLEGRRLDLHVVELGSGIDDDGAFSGGLTDNLLARLALLRHKHHQIALHLAPASQTAAGQLGMRAPILAFAAVGRAQMIGSRRDRMFRELALLDGHLAFAAGLPAIADGFDLDAHRARGVEERCAVGHLSLAA